MPRYKSSIFTVWQPRKSSYFWQASAWKAPAKKRNEIFLINVFFFFKSWQKNLSDFNAWQKNCPAPRQDDGAFEDKLGLTKLVSRFRKTLAIAPKP